MSSEFEKTIKGKAFWQNKTVLAHEFEKRMKETYAAQINFTPVILQSIVLNLPNESFEMLKLMYISAVVEEKVEYDVSKEIDRLCEEDAKNNYISSDPAPTIPFYELPEEKRKELIDKEKSIFNETRRKKIAEKRTNQAIKIAELTIERIIKLAKDNKIKKNQNGQPVTSPFAILYNITEEYNQESYLVDSEYEKWLSHFCQGNVPKKDDGSIDKDAEIEVYCFQCGDLGAGNFMTYGGNIGANDGMFVISSSEYFALLNDKELFNDDGQCINISKLSARLGNVPLGSNPICIKQKIKLGDLKTSKGSLRTAYFGEFGPPLSTQGGYDENGNYIEGRPEAVVPQTQYLINGKINSNIEIISHSKNISTEELRKISQNYLLKSQQFRDSETETIDHVTLTSKLDNDRNTLKRFKELLTKEEAQYLSKLMIHMQSTMQIEDEVIEKGVVSR